MEEGSPLSLVLPVPAPRLSFHICAGDGARENDCEVPALLGHNWTLLPSKLQPWVRSSENREGELLKNYLQPL